MIRLLLSLLALVSGLVVQGAPAQARLCIAHDTEIGAPAPQRAVAHVAARGVSPAVGAGTPAALASGSVLPWPAVDVATRAGVLIGIDRARE